MATKIQIEDIRRINELYYDCHNYSEVARQTGFSASTVKKYVDKSYSPINANEIIHFNRETDFPKKFSNEIFTGVDNYGDLCVLTEDEIIGIKLLWKEITV